MSRTTQLAVSLQFVTLGYLGAGLAGAVGMAVFSAALVGLGEVAL